MAEPRRAATTASRIDDARFLVVEARYYDDIGAFCCKGARALSKPRARPSIS